MATGSYTVDGRVVIGHNDWTTYADGERWNIVFDIVPAGGYHILMDGMAGLIHSGDDFGINSPASSSPKPPSATSPASTRMACPNW